MNTAELVYGRLTADDMQELAFLVAKVDNGNGTREEVAALAILHKLLPGLTVLEVVP